MTTTTFAAATRAPAGTAQHRAAIDAPTWAPIGRALECIAGFFDDEAQAQQALRELRVVHKLLPSQCVLLAPADAAPLQFAQLARQWAGRWPARSGSRSIGTAWIGAGLGALLGGVAAAGWLMFEPELWADQQALEVTLWVALALLSGALVGAAGALLLNRPTQPQRFDRNVQHQLARGRWAVVVHGVSWGHQEGVVTLLRSGGVDWCAATPSTRRL